MIIDATYFWGKLNCAITADVVGSSPVLVNKQTTELNQYISAYEPELLKLILGDNLYAEYISGRETVEKWINLDAYIVDSTAKTSMIANYVFCKYWNDKDYSINAFNTFKSKKDNQTSVSNSIRIIPAWNEMIDKIIDMMSFLQENKDIYCETYEYNYLGWNAFISLSIDNHAIGKYMNSLGI